MSSRIREKVSHIERELADLKRLIAPSRKLSVDEKIERYHNLLDRISKSIVISKSPDEIISELHRKEY